MKRSLKTITFLSALTLTLVACNESTPTVSQPTPKPSESKKAQAEIINSQGIKVGNAEFFQEQDRVKAKIEVSNLLEGRHGVHIHAVGKCEVPDFKTAGPHFNPEGKKHGTKNKDGAHAGDLPNLDVSANGEGKAEFDLNGVTLEMNQVNSLFQDDGTAIVIHDKEDDYQSDPSGNSGSRIACGVIQSSKSRE